MKTLQEQQKAEREAQARNAAAVQITSEILKEVLNEETLNSATEEFRQVVLVYYRSLSFISLMNELLSQKGSIVTYFKHLLVILIQCSNKHT